MNDVRNSLSSFMAQRASVNLETPWYLYSSEGPFEMSLYIIRLKELKKEVGPK